MPKVAGMAMRPIKFRRVATSATIQTVRAMAAMVRSQTRPVVEALTYHASIRPESPVPVSRMELTNQYIGWIAPQIARARYIKRSGDIRTPPSRRWTPRGPAEPRLRPARAGHLLRRRRARAGRGGRSASSPHPYAAGDVARRPRNGVRHAGAVAADADRGAEADGVATGEGEQPEDRNEFLHARRSFQVAICSLTRTGAVPP